MNAQEMQIENDLKDFEKDSDWFYENMDKLRQQNLVNKFVAIKKEQVIAFGDNVEIVIQRVEKEGQNPSFIFMGFVYPEGYTLLL